MTTLYDNAIETDARWMVEIKRAFPTKRAGDVRYTVLAHGEPGSRLRAAYDAYVEARAMWDIERAAFYADQRAKRQAALIEFVG